MDTCRSCGASLSPDLAWCGRCFAPVAPGPATLLPGGAGARIGAPGSVQTSLRQRELATVPQFSRWKAGPTSFGALGRIAMTIGLLLGLVVGYPMARGGMLAAVGVDIPGTPFMIGYLAIAVPLALYLLARIWKRARVA